MYKSNAAADSMAYTVIKSEKKLHYSTWWTQNTDSEFQASYNFDGQIVRTLIPYLNISNINTVIP